MKTLTVALQLLAKDKHQLKLFLRNPLRWISTLPAPVSTDEQRELEAIHSDALRFLERECRLEFDEQGERNFVAGSDLARRRFLIRASSTALALPFAAIFAQASKAAPTAAAREPRVVDTESCEDSACENTTTCKDTDLCLDQQCTNSVFACKDETGCQDVSCTNNPQCNDENVCGDNDCTNQVECKDLPDCTDAPNCANNGANGCTDGQCRDAGCADVQTCFDGSGCKDTPTCTNQAMCTDTQCSDKGCSNVESCGDTKTCQNDPC